MGLVYHYTSIDSLMGIVANRELWASDIRYCNDATESIYGREEVFKNLRVEAERVRTDRPNIFPGDQDSRPDDQYARDDPEFWATVLESIREQLVKAQSGGAMRAWAVCFSAHEDALSQWRAYGQAGCAIGFDDDWGTLVRGDELQMTVAMVPVRYGPEGVRQTTERLAKYGWVPIPSAQMQEKANLTEMYAHVAAMELAALKDPGFSEEAETRLVVTTPYRDNGDALHAVKYRTSATGLLIPYVPVPISLSAIKEIRVGPGVHQAKNFEALQGWATTAAWPSADGFNPRITYSETPFQ